MKKNIESIDQCVIKVVCLILNNNLYSKKIMPIVVQVRDGNVGKSLMQLKRTLIKEGLFKELKKRKFYVKPSLARKLKREAAEKQRNKDLKREIRAALKADF